MVVEILYGERYIYICMYILYNRNIIIEGQCTLLYDANSQKIYNIIQTPFFYLKYVLGI